MHVYYEFLVRRKKKEKKITGALPFLYALMLTQFCTRVERLKEVEISFKKWLIFVTFCNFFVIICQLVLIFCKLHSCLSTKIFITILSNVDLFHFLLIEKYAYVYCRVSH